MSRRSRSLPYCLLLGGLAWQREYEEVERQVKHLNMKFF
jgi:hypothetical protein